MSKYQVSDDELATALDELSGWEVKEGKLHKTFKFETFAQAIGWMMSAAIHADKLDHHPEWFNVYNKVRVDLITHDLGQVISNLDLDLAAKMDELASPNAKE